MLREMLRHLLRLVLRAMLPQMLRFVANFGASSDAWHVASCVASGGDLRRHALPLTSVRGFAFDFYTKNIRGLFEICSIFVREIFD